MTTSYISKKCYTGQLNFGKEFDVTTFPVSNVTKFNANYIEIYQDDNKIYDHGIKILLTYDGEILKELRSQPEKLDKWHELYNISRETDLNINIRKHKIM